LPCFFFYSATFLFTSFLLMLQFDFFFYPLPRCNVIMCISIRNVMPQYSRSKYEFTNAPAVLIVIIVECVISTSAWSWSVIMYFWVFWLHFTVYRCFSRDTFVIFIPIGAISRLVILSASYKIRFIWKIKKPIDQYRADGWSIGVSITDRKTSLQRCRFCLVRYLIQNRSLNRCWHLIMLKHRSYAPFYYSTLCIILKYSSTWSLTSIP
jgi:hypothetical protein